MKLSIQAIIFLILGTFFITPSFASEKVGFNEDAFLRDVSSEDNDDLDELEELEFRDSNESEDEDISNAFSDEDDFKENFTNDLNTIPKQTAPKLNPNTKIVTTKNGKYIYHPNQEKGLYKITRESEYHYKYKKSKLKGFIHVKGGSVNLENFPNQDDTVQFNDLYDSTSLTTVYFEYEWQPFKTKRSLSLKAGGGISYARGRGRFIGDGNTNAGLQAQEAYTFMMFPLSAGAIYKFKFIHDQLFMPFATGGIDYNFATEFRSGFKALKYTGILAAHFGGGVLLNLGWLEKAASLELDREFGINNTYLSLEGRQIVSLYDDADINGFVFLAGLSFEY